MTELSSTESARQVRAYDFQSQETLERGRLRRLTPILEAAAHRITGALTGVVRTAVRVEVGELDQQRWEDFANSLPQPTFLASVIVVPIGGRVMLHVPLPLCMALVELRLGGEPTGGVPTRPLTDIEHRLVDELSRTVLSETLLALSMVTPMTVGATTTASNAVFIQAADPSELCLLVSLGVAVTDGTALDATLCVPLSVLLPLLDALERIDTSDDMGEPDSVADEVRARLLEAPLEVRVSFPEIVLSPEELLTLAVGDVIPLHRPEGLPVRLYAGGTQFCDVVPTTQGKRLACMVVESQKPEDQ